jgi:hypothetical protein
MVAAPAVIAFADSRAAPAALEQRSAETGGVLGSPWVGLRLLRSLRTTPATAAAAGLRRARASAAGRSSFYTGFTPSVASGGVLSLSRGHSSRGCVGLAPPPGSALDWAVDLLASAPGRLALRRFERLRRDAFGSALAVAAAAR